MLLMSILEKAGLVVASAQNVAPGAATPSPATVIIQTRVISIRELVAPGPAHLAGPKGFKATPDDVFAAAKIAAPENGWTVEKFRELAAKPVYRDMSADHKQKALLAELATASVDPAAIIADAVRKDQALDAYERFLQERLAQTKAEAVLKKKALEAEIAGLARLAETTEADFKAWQEAKKSKERELADSLKPLMADGKISLS